MHFDRKNSSVQRRSADVRAVFRARNSCYPINYYLCFSFVSVKCFLIMTDAVAIIALIGVIYSVAYDLLQSQDGLRLEAEK